MASNKTGMTDADNVKKSGGLAGALITMIAAGLAGGTVLIAGAKVIGDLLLYGEADRVKRLEEQRAIDREEVKRIAAVEEGEIH